MHTHGVAKGQRREGRPLPTGYATCWRVFGMSLFELSILLLIVLGLLIEK
jgi:hypothetical protein